MDDLSSDRGNASAITELAKLRATYKPIGWKIGAGRDGAWFMARKGTVLCVAETARRLKMRIQICEAMAARARAR